MNVMKDNGQDVAKEGLRVIKGIAAQGPHDISVPSQGDSTVSLDLGELDDLKINRFSLTFNHAKTRRAFNGTLADSRGAVWSQGGMALMLAGLLFLYRDGTEGGNLRPFYVVYILLLLSTVLATRSGHFQRHSEPWCALFITILGVVIIVPVVTWDNEYRNEFFWAIIFIMHALLPFMGVVLQVNFILTFVIFITCTVTMGLAMVYAQVYPAWFLIPSLLITDAAEVGVGYVNNLGRMTAFVEIVHNLLKKAELHRTENKRKTAWMAQEAHDLGTPMTVMKLGLSAIEVCPQYADMVDNSGVGPILTLMGATIDMMELLRENALDRARSYMGSAPQPQFGPVNIREVIRKCQCTAKNITSEQVHVLTKVSPDVASFVRGDQIWCWQMMMNLIHNAAKHCHEGKISCNVYIRRYLSCVYAGNSSYQLGNSAAMSPLSSPGNLAAPQCSRCVSHTTDKMSSGHSNFSSRVADEESGMDLDIVSKVTSSVQGRKVDEMLRFEVEDTGVGVPLSKKGLLFKAPEGAGQQSGGSGMGLYGVAQKAKALGGRAGHEGMYGGTEGKTKFYFEFPYLPLSTDETNKLVELERFFKPHKGQTSVTHAARISRETKEEVDQESKQEKKPDEEDCRSTIHSGDLGTGAPSSIAQTEDSDTKSPVKCPQQRPEKIKKILLVDDEVLACSFFKNLLENMNWSVDIARDGKIGLEMIRTNIFNSNDREGRYSGIITDYHMPGLNGIEMATQYRDMQRERIKQDLSSRGDGLIVDNYRVPVCLMTASGRLYGDPMKLIKEGLFDFVPLHKPLNFEELNKVLKEMVGGKFEMKLPVRLRDTQSECPQGAVDDLSDLSNEHNKRRNAKRGAAALSKRMAGGSRWLMEHRQAPDMSRAVNRQAAVLGLTHHTDLKVNKWTQVFSNKNIRNDFNLLLARERSIVWNIATIIVTLGSSWHVVFQIAMGKDASVAWFPLILAMVFALVSLGMRTKIFKNNSLVWSQAFVLVLITLFCFTLLSSLSDRYHDSSYYWGTQGLFVISTMLLMAALHVQFVLLVSLSFIHTLCLLRGLTKVMDGERDAVFMLTTVLCTVIVGVAFTFQHLKSRCEGFINVITSAIQNEKVLQQDDTRKSEWMAQVSHDLGTPMTVLKLGLEDVMLHTGFRKGTAENNLHREVFQMQTTMELMVLLRSNAYNTNQKLVPEIKPMDVRELVKKTWTMMECLVCTKALGLKCVVDPDIDRIILSDNVWCYQMLMNLLHNSIKHCHSGSISLHLSLRDDSKVNAPVIFQRKKLRLFSRGSGDPGTADTSFDMESGESSEGIKRKLRFEVEDSGAWVPAAMEGKLFQAFSKLDGCGPGSVKGGSGLGLYGVLQKATALNGTAGYLGAYMDTPDVPAHGRDALGNSSNSSGVSTAGFVGAGGGGDATNALPGHSAAGGLGGQASSVENSEVGRKRKIFYFEVDYVPATEMDLSMSRDSADGFNAAGELDLSTAVNMDVERSDLSVSRGTEGSSKRRADGSKKHATLQSSVRLFFDDSHSPANALTDSVRALGEGVTPTSDSAMGEEGLSGRGWLGQRENEICSEDQSDYDSYSSSLGDESSTCEIRENRRVLVIDDDPSIGNMLGLILARNGCVVETAQDGFDGLAKIRADAEKGGGLSNREHPDLPYLVIFTDFEMPNMDGGQLCHKYRELKKDAEKRGVPYAVPIWLMTAGRGYEDDSEGRMLEDRLVDKVINKPPHLQEILIGLKEAMARESGQ